MHFQQFIFLSMLTTYETFYYNKILKRNLMPPLEIIGWIKIDRKLGNLLYTGHNVRFAFE